MKLGTHIPGGERRKPIHVLIMRFVGQRSRSQLLKIEQKLDTFFVSARYLIIKNEMLDLNESWYILPDCGGGSLLILRFVGQRSRSHYPSTCSQLGFRTFGALLIFMPIASQALDFQHHMSSFLCSLSYGER